MSTLQDRRFWAKVAVGLPGDRWPWLASTNGNGYGQIRRNGKLQRAHRVSWELANGRPVAAELQIDHLCRNRGCQNPTHLEVVTARVNLMRGDTTTAANAAKTHCPQGHEYTPENTWTDRGSRVCRECKCAQVRASYRRRKVGAR